MTSKHLCQKCGNHHHPDLGCPPEMPRFEDWFWPFIDKLPVPLEKYHRAWLMEEAWKALWRKTQQPPEEK